jgi:hypothetical protein
MKAGRFILAGLLFAALLCGCGRTKGEDLLAGPYTPSITSPVKFRVVDVWNDTGQLFDVDVIGLLWNGLEKSLLQKGMLWTPQFSEKPYTLEAHVVRYKKGSFGMRLIPFSGETLLVVRCDLKDGDRVIATLESSRKFSFANGTLTREAWRKVFTEVSEDLVTQALRKV